MSTFHDGANIRRALSTSMLAAVLVACGTVSEPEPVDYPLGPVLALEPETPRLASPVPGDEVLFGDTGGDKPLVGVVESVGGGGEVRFRYTRGGRVWRGVLNLVRPDSRRDGHGRILNSYVRTKRRGDPPDARYLAGELLIGFRVKGR
jgi:hypothetical protein